MNLPGCDLWQFRLNVECETAEILDIDAPTSAQVIVEICDESSPNDLHLTDRKITVKRGNRTVNQLILHRLAKFI